MLKANDIWKKIKNTVFPRSVAAATINFSFTEVRRLSEGGVYSRAAFILPAAQDFRQAPSTHVSLPSSPFYCYYSRALSQSLYYTIARRQRDRDSLFTSAHAHCNCSYECGYCSRAPGGHYYAQPAFFAAPIRGRRLFGVRRLFKEIR